MTDGEGVDTPGEDAAPSPRRRRSRRRTIVLVVLSLAVAVAVWTVVASLVAAHRLHAVRADISQLTNTDDLDRTTLQRRLAADLRKVQSADALVDGVGPRLVGLVPIVGRNVTAERTVAEASAAALRAGLVLARATDDLGDGAGGVDVERLRVAGVSLTDAADQLREPLARLAALRTAWTIPPVPSGVRQARDQLLGLDDRLRRGGEGLQALVGVLGGTDRRSIVVGLMNNAELRGAGGLLSAYAVGKLDNGQLTLGRFHEVDSIASGPAHAARVPAPADFHAAYGPYLADTTLWKNVTMSPRADESAAVFAAVTAASLRVHPDVVVLLDVPAAAAIASATGPVTIGGESVNADQLTRRLLVDAYGRGKINSGAQARRRQALTAAASQAFSRLRQDAALTPSLLQALSDAVSGRHLVIWSARPDEERRLALAGAAGNVDPEGGDVALVTTNNLGDGRRLGNKLDYYVDRTVRVDVRLHRTQADVTQTVTFHNASPAGLGPYVQGVTHPGRVSELLSLDVAHDATLTSFSRDGEDTDVEVRSADGSKQLTTLLRLPRGETTSYRVTYTVPLHDSRYQLLLVPQALARPAQLELHVSAVDATLGVVTGADQPVDDKIDETGSWDGTRRITIPVYGYRGLRGILHAVAHFWTHKVSL